ncbi:MAG TPA: hypothetical protein VJA23_02250 [Candidatus Nanoarchaeia archaeon]|nr:hypothetical protein [Candidatus Nanoarchaeia archaeon]
MKFPHLKAVLENSPNGLAINGIKLISAIEMPARPIPLLRQ